MKIERIMPGIALKKIIHYSAGGRIEKKFESKDKDAYFPEFLTYLEKYCNDNGYTVFAIDQGIYYIKKE